MSTLLTNVGTVITSLVSWLGSVATGLIENEIFQIMVAIVIFTLLFRLMVGLAKGIKDKKRKRDIEEIESMPYYNLDDDNYNLYDDNDEPVNTEELFNLDNDDYDDYLSSLNGHNDI